MQSMNKVQQGQSFIDMVYQQTGSIDEVVAMALKNGKSITNEVSIGESISPTKITNMEVFSLFQNRNPATAIRANKNDTLEGIGYWAIEKDFKI